MTPEIKERWLEALRNNRYIQGRGQLREASKDGDRFCCLGVLIDIAAPERWIDPGNIPEGSNVLASYRRYDEEMEDWEDEETEFAEGELDGDLEIICGVSSEQAADLITLNDGHKWTPKDNLNVGDDPGPKRGEVIDGIAYQEGKSPQDFFAIANYIEANL